MKSGQSDELIAEAKLSEVSLERLDFLLAQVLGPVE